MPKDPKDFIKLSQFLKMMNLVESGGQAKLIIQDGQVLVNGEREIRRGRKLVRGDTVTFEGKTYSVTL